MSFDFKNTQSLRDTANRAMKGRTPNSLVTGPNNQQSNNLIQGTPTDNDGDEGGKKSPNVHRRKKSFPR